ncbi:MAG TPA: AbrB/MazE/SpoVT family DNA-binding domain-containing protein [Geminicoccaceae bacterium]|nr:AbrB/MazE/SpoVT family DNA-binding domain-containing protein [Geminicoccaceae bacterium]
MSSRHVKIAPGGRVVLPAEFRRALGVGVGDSVVIELRDGELRLRSLDAATRRAQEIVSKDVPEGVSLADELIREWREEAARDEQE